MGNIHIQHPDTTAGILKFSLLVRKTECFRHDTHTDRPNGYYFKIPVEEVSYILGFIPPHTEVYNYTVLRKLGQSQL